MKTIGVIGGLTWHSTLDYYRMLNELVNKELGGLNAAKMILYSVNFAEIKELTDAGNWKEIANQMSNIAKNLEKAGAGCLLIGANTMHRVADEIQQNITIPVIHVAEATANAITQQGLRKVGLLGTKYTMQLDFYKDRLSAKGVDAIIPSDPEIEYINNAIFDEMGKGLFLPQTKTRFLNIIDVLIQQGAEGIILGCTEIPILIKPDDCPVPVFDTTLIHARAVVDYALSA